MCIAVAVAASLAMYATGLRSSDRKTAAPIGPPLPQSPDNPPVSAPPIKRVALDRGRSLQHNSLIITSRISAAPMHLVTISLGRSEKPKAPSAASGSDVTEKSATDFQAICFQPVLILAMFPINCAIVSIGTAISAPTHAVAIGSNKSDPPKPAAPDKRAAKKLPISNAIIFKKAPY